MVSSLLHKTHEELVSLGSRAESYITSGDRQRSFYLDRKGATRSNQAGRKAKAPVLFFPFVVNGWRKRKNGEHAYDTATI